MIIILNVNEGIPSFQNSFTGAQIFKDHYTGSPFFLYQSTFQESLQSFKKEQQSRTAVNELLRATIFSSYLWLYSLSTTIITFPNFKLL